MENQGFLAQAPGFATTAIHAGQDPEKWNSRCVVPPIVLSTTFQQPAPAEPIVSIYNNYKTSFLFTRLRRSRKEG